MRRKLKFGIVVAALLAAGIAHGAQRTFVSTLGADANACAITTPCRGFAKALTVTDPGGEIVVLDSGGYGSVTVNKNVSILSSAGAYAGISVFATSDGITVAAPATKVVLRGLTINGQGGDNGIRVQAGEVHVENVIISNMGAAGILVEGGTSVRISSTTVRSNADGLRVQPTAGSVVVLVRDSELSNNTTAGIGVSPSAGGSSAQVTVERTSVTRNGAGLTAAPVGGATAMLVVTQSVASENVGAGVSSAGSGASVWVRESAVTRNNVGLQQASSGILNACGANLLVANNTAQSGAIVTTSCLDVATTSGTVTNVATGSGLAGGPITAAGTISVANAGITAAMLASNGCGNGQLLKWSGIAWTCQNDIDTNSGGTVTNVSTGTGLTGGPITTIGTVSIANGGVGNTQLANGSVDVSKLNTTSTDGRYFKQGDNAFGATAVLGTSDANPVQINANASRVMRYEPNATSPNIIGGHPSNSAGITNGQTIAGGGQPGAICYDPTTGVSNHSCANSTAAQAAAIGGGYGNTASGVAATVAGGYANIASPNNYAAIGGGFGNVASGSDSTVAGGYVNTASNDYSTVGGGSVNTSSGDRSTVGGGSDNAATGPQSTIAGGASNTASGNIASVGGGISNLAAGPQSTVAGGQGNGAMQLFDTVVGGYNNHANGAYAFVAGGDSNAATGSNATVGGGSTNSASGGLATIPGGIFNVASGYGSFAAGNHAKTQDPSGTTVHDGAFVWADDHTFDFNSTVDNEFAARATGGVRLVLGINIGTGAPTWSCTVAFGGSWACSSDRNQKQNLRQLDGQEVLAQLSKVPIYQWNPKGENAQHRHFGPTAQDFYAAFGLGDSELRIGQQDVDGVALAAIQGLNAKLESVGKAKDEQIAAQARELAEQRVILLAQERELADIRVLVEAMHQAFQTEAGAVVAASRQ